MVLDNRFVAAFLALLTGAFLTALFVVVRVAAAFAFAALAALAFFRLAISFALAAAESFRFGLVGVAAGFAGWDSPRVFAHRRF